MVVWLGSSAAWRFAHHGDHPVSRFPSGFRAVLSRRVSCSILRALLRALLLSTLPLPLPFIFLSLFFAFPLARHFSPAVLLLVLPDGGRILAMAEHKTANSVVFGPKSAFER